ncbi:hypothetical protein KIL84_015157 [Mauremys mutica]|uniref:Uncharacterized protein n=1 Tax=Mauremys mutica TaxID=74926 RepID=A0A9D3WSM1_9SAUR|nr:hypothetical protein KIL84_015157 [Mauremys mutica]
MAVAGPLPRRFGGPRLRAPLLSGAYAALGAALGGRLPSSSPSDRLGPPMDCDPASADPPTSPLGPHIMMKGYGLEQQIADPDPKDNVTYRHIVPWIGKGLLVLHGPKWYQHRKLLTPGFHYDVLKPYVPLIADSTKVMLDKWEQLIAQEKSVELFEHVSLMTLDSIMKCAFSYQSNCQTDSYLVHHRLRIFPYHNDLVYWLSPHGFQFMKACQLAHHHTDHGEPGAEGVLSRTSENVEKVQKKRHLELSGYSSPRQ